MRLEPSRAVYAVFLAALLAASPSCGGSSGGQRASSPVITRVEFRDQAARGVLDADILLVTFSGPVFIGGKVPASDVFELDPIAPLGASVASSGPGIDQVTVEVQPGAAFTPEGRYPQDPGASGLRVAAGNQLLLGSAAINPVSSLAFVDIEGRLDIGEWNRVSAPMLFPRVVHTATLLPNGEILIVGGHDGMNSTNYTGSALGGAPVNIRTLGSIEIFDPVQETFVLAADSLVEPRAFHTATRTPGRDGIIDTNDDYVVIVGGYTTEDPLRPLFGGGHGIGSVEVILPDPNEDGMTDDLVVNPVPDPVVPNSWMSGGAVVTDTGLTITVRVMPDPSNPSNCLDTDVPVGFQWHEVEWMPEANLSGGGGNNELFVWGGTFQAMWNECAGDWGGGKWFFAGPNWPTNCEDGHFYIQIDPDNRGDLSDSAIVLLVSPVGQPFSTPYSLVRDGYTLTRIAGPDGIEGTYDDALLLYGGYGFETTPFCTGGSVCSSNMGDLEYFDWNVFLTTGQAIHTELRSTMPVCPNGVVCSSPGVGPTDRWAAEAVATGNESQEVVVVGGYSSGHNQTPLIPCSQAPEVLSIRDFRDPKGSAGITYSGLDTIDRLWDHTVSALPRSGNVVVAGGVDLNRPGTTASSAYVQPSFRRTDPLPDLWQRRNFHAAVTIPADPTGQFDRDRVYVFGGEARDWTSPICFAPAGSGYCGPTTILDSVEYFEEFNGE